MFLDLEHAWSRQGYFVGIKCNFVYIQSRGWERHFYAVGGIQDANLDFFFKGSLLEIASLHSHNLQTTSEVFLLVGGEDRGGKGEGAA